MSEASTPARRQYLDIKRRYPNTLVIFRMGDFYESFDEDAKTVAKELDITLTSRPQGKEGRIPLAGFPHHSLPIHLKRLVSRGFKVAVCEQVQDPRLAKGVVEREVVRVVTPGTIVEEELLSAAANNYLVAVVPEGSARAGRGALGMESLPRGSSGYRRPQRAGLRRRHDGRVLLRRGVGRRPRNGARAPRPV